MDRNTLIDFYGVCISIAEVYEYTRVCHAYYGRVALINYLRRIYDCK